MDTALTPQPPLMSPDIPFSAFRTLNLAEEIFFEALPLLPPWGSQTASSRSGLNTSTEVWQVHEQISNLSVFLNSSHKSQTGKWEKPVNFPSRSPWWSCWYQIKLVSALTGVLAGLTPRICQLPSHRGNHGEYQAGHLSVSNYRKYHLPFVQGVWAMAGARHKPEPVSSSSSELPR